MDLGHNTYLYDNGLFETGDYFLDTLRFGPYIIHNQAIAAGVSGIVPFNDLGAGFPQDEVGVTSVASSITAVRIHKIEAVTVQVFGHFPPK
jgi:hypothetical protein